MIVEELRDTLIRGADAWLFWFYFSTRKFISLACQMTVFPGFITSTQYMNLNMVRSPCTACELTQERCVSCPWSSMLWKQHKQWAGWGSRSALPSIDPTIWCWDGRDSFTIKQYSVSTCPSGRDWRRLFVLWESTQLSKEAIPAAQDN